ncbi:MAG: YiiG family protein [Saprospiraceae bacterium]|nr:YiiG family protein [Pyrinomonadaceae bacterium]
MRKSTNFFTAILALAVLLTVSMGCSQLSKLREKRVAEGNQDTIPTFPPSGKEEAPKDVKTGLSEKTQLYITKCFNPYANRVMDSYQRYTSWVKNENTGPTGRESIVYGLYDVSGDGEDCIAAVAEAQEMEPELPEVEQSAGQYSAALKEAVYQIRSVYKYYDQEDYKDDKFQKGKEAHASLIAAFKNFETVNKSFAAALDDLETKVSNDQLEELRGDPAKKFEFSVVDFNVKAKKISSFVQRTPYGSMNADELQNLNDELEPAINTMKEEGKANMFAGMYFSAAEDLLKASKELMRRIRDKEPFDSFESSQIGTSGGWMVDGSPDKVIYAYNQLISRRSMLRF